MNTRIDLLGAMLVRAVCTLLALSGMAAPTFAGETITYFHNDAAGSPVIATDANGLIAWRETYRPYGTRVNQSAASANNHVWFAGRSHDDSTGLSYMGARYYDPLIGRFLSMDPMGVDFANLYTFNRYAYANNNPYRFTDPSGWESQTLETVTITARREYIDPSIIDFLRNSTRELELTHGENSWSLAFWNVTAGGFVATANEVADGQYVGAGLELVLAMVKPLRAARGMSDDVLKEAELLRKRLLSDEGVTELLQGGGEIIAGPGSKVVLRDAPRLAAQYGGQTSDWVKISSTAPGHMQTHAYKNIQTGEVVELKSIIE